jgi:hypothetical protein
MEPTVRNPRTESAIGSDAAQSLHLSRRFPNAGWSLPVRNSVAGNGIFGCRDWRPKIHPRDRYCRQRPGTLKIGDKIPAETARFRSTTVCAVREDWMVVCAVRYEPVSTPNCLITGFLQGIFANSCLLSENAPAFAALIQ